MDLSGQNIPANKMIDLRITSSAVGKIIHMAKGMEEDFHVHTWHQLVYPVTGLLQTQAKQSKFLVPRTTAVLVPAGVVHASSALTDTVFLGIYINPNICPEFEHRIMSVSVSAFMRELMLTLKKECESESLDSEIRTARLIEVLYDQMKESQTGDFSLLIPRDRRIKLIFEKLTEEPSLNYTLSEWSNAVGATQRTLTRLFSKEFSTSFSLWRQHLRLVCSLPLLEEGLPIQSISHKVGYQNDSSFIKAFKARFGMTPIQFRNNHETLY
ncbi:MULTISPECIES: AraC family transcriptional regulator [Vibrio]|jgi:AraC-like DNA-binding protein/quercetin dioxygenase-like cupin family protein|uniref:Helix-turn-helix transcriptional regulator n=1 Tax=Vibrio neptunius TaxID=170651 RepID=A0ABS3A3H4_9VIBR|nr:MULTISPECIES: helix-turn-helix transcriptional regulator [Vibrio]EEX35172.1 transcriptional regulator [Vibrio coralliilyticus ATCC BAA-450]MBN3494197.1 helix-turn-helix transcriptional regulator [Vibrio neptunius]MBN3516601.1 helix-turn-helix transcriptional regulator [Vibrio neptunius]MBN3550912.1 helix-turn-helix transcriptional regulator [Vibrio neptunius]MBN3579041.1 helix-turn-helix transcriptional regulator [Vibrio neptunius]